jgi:hypothetical protein
MTRTHKILVAVGVAFCLMFGGVAFALHHVVTSQGIVSIDVVEKTPGGARVKIVVPGVLVNFCLSFLPVAMPEHERMKLQNELSRYEPLLAAVVDELEQAPDMVFVEVEDGDEHVTIAKRDGHLVIDVETGQEDVRVEVPVVSVRATWHSLASNLS